MAKPIKIWDGSQWVDVAINVPSITGHAEDTTNIHGITDTANLVYTSDSRLTDSRTPTAHASSHGSAGSDAITIAQSQVTNLTTDLSAKAPLASPTFTGTPAAPTASVGTDTTQVATTAFVNAEISNDAILKTTVNAKGDLLTATANDTPAILTVGSNGQMLMADSSATAGLRYVDPPANRNRLINGGMILDQRNAGASLTPTAGGQYCLDRWANNISAGSKYSVQRSTTAPAGFTNSMLITSLAATTPAAGDIYEVYNVIEGYDVRDLGFGAAGASTITLSFWVRSSLTGTFCGRIGNTGTAATPNRTWVFEYSVAVADTWERKTVTISGDTAGTWNKTDGAGLRVGFTLGAGTNFDATAGAWNSANRAMTTSGIDLVATNGATLYLTGVQLETGPVATPFEFEPYETTLRKCQRYYYRNTAGSIYQAFASGHCTTSTTAAIYIQHPVPMRATPTSLDYSTLGITNSSGAAISLSSAAINYAGPSGAFLSVGVSSGLTAGNGTLLLAANNINSYIGFNAEL